LAEKVHAASDVRLDPGFNKNNVPARCADERPEVALREALGVDVAGRLAMDDYLMATNP
jgi:hypothetical protein